MCSTFLKGLNAVKFFVPDQSVSRRQKLAYLSFKFVMLKKSITLIRSYQKTTECRQRFHMTSQSTPDQINSIPLLEV